MTRETGNGKVADPVKLREALDQIKGDAVVIPEEEMAVALHELHNEALEQEIPALASGKAEGTEFLLDAPYKANIARLAQENIQSQPTNENNLHTIEWEPQAKTPLSEIISTPTAPVSIEEEKKSISSESTSATIENPKQAAHEEAKKKYIEVSKAFVDGTATREDVAKAVKEVGETRKAAESWGKENKVTPEGRMEAIQRKLSAMSSEGLERAKKGGVYTLERYRDAGEFYKKQPLKTKLLLSVGLLGLAGGAAFVGGTVGASVASVAGAASFAQRLFGSAATFVAIEGALKAAEEKKNDGKERSEAVKIVHTTEAAIIAALVGSGALGHAMQYWSNWEDAKNITEKMVAPESTTVEETVIDIPAEVTPLSTEYIVPPGGTVWAGLTEKLNMQDSFSGLQEGQKTYVVDVLKNKLASMSEADLKAIGISSGNIDKINIGDKINFNALLSNQELIQKATEHASSLSGEQIQNIETSAGANISPESAPIPAEILPSTTEALSGETMPQGMNPASPEIIAEANKTLKVDLDRILGKTGGFLGLGGTHGVESTHWRNPELGFANKTVTEVLQAVGRPNGLLPGSEKIGIENYEKVASMQKYLNDVKTFSGLTPAPGEKVEEFIKRGAVKMLSKN